MQFGAGGALRRPGIFPRPDTAGRDDAGTGRPLHAGCATRIAGTQGNPSGVHDGKSAGQHILHVHFHVIPRDKGDRIKIDVWKSKKIAKSEFMKLNKKIKSLIKNNAN